MLLDDDGVDARRMAESWQQEGFAAVRALYGGLRLWRLCFPPDVVGEETFLEEVAESRE